MRHAIIEAIIYIIVLVAMLLIAYFGSKAECSAKTHNFWQHEYTFLSGCMVRDAGMTSSRWIPLENVRVGRY